MFSVGAIFIVSQKNILSSKKNLLQPQYEIVYVRYMCSTR